jgi:raffinose/stachyose/melibiose transport system permease protein
MKGDRQISWGKIIGSAFLLVVSVFALAPLLWMLSSSIKSDGEFMTNPFGLPRQVTFENFYRAWIRGNFTQYFANSIFVSSFSLFLMIGLGAMVAFAMTRFRQIRYSGAVLVYFVIGQMISAQVIIISVYITLVQFKLIDNLAGLSLVYVASGLPFTVFLLQGYFKTLPFELYEAARMDGYGDFRMFLEIALPLSRPALATALIIQFLYVFNEFVLALIAIRTPARNTVPVGIWNAVRDMYSTSYTTACAGLVITGIPVILIYAVFQKQIMSGITAGALKG